MLVYTLNFIDRTLIAVVAQPIINTFSLTDSQWGLLSGPPFAIFYAVMGLPIALWADRSNRVRIIAVCIVFWSAMTVLCGFAAGFLTLLLFRVGVAIGEAGCTPPANSATEVRPGLVLGSVFKTDGACRKARHGGFDSRALPPLVHFDLVSFDMRDQVHGFRAERIAGFQT